MRRLLSCLRRGHWPRIHRSPRAVICLRCLPCMTCGGTTAACVGWCAEADRP
ncbi:hypothetical protein [Sphaerisporangium album]|uniref:hypothetical protein n=1 Tax=Sphaerisporangium album TaxID=509200 RepID=UPI0015F0B19D|nr:hypothetical protein [Sphaerisporangium album]